MVTSASMIQFFRTDVVAAISVVAIVRSGRCLLILIIVGTTLLPQNNITIRVVESLNSGGRDVSGGSAVLLPNMSVNDYIEE